MLEDVEKREPLYSVDGNWHSDFEKRYADSSKNYKQKYYMLFLYTEPKEIKSISQKQNLYSHVHCCIIHKNNT